MVERVFQHPANRRTLNMKTGDMMNTYLIFSGIQIWEAQFLPTDILLDLDLIREWAISKGLVFDEGQFVSHEDAHEAAQLFTPDDGLQILVDLFPEDSSAVKYMEYIYVPISRLIKRDLEIRLIFWRTQTNLVQFGFWVKHSFLEYTSQSTGPIIVRKFS